MTVRLKAKRDLPSCITCFLLAENRFDIWVRALAVFVLRLPLLDGTAGGTCLTRGTASRERELLSSIGPAGLPARRLSSWWGSSGRPGCSDINGRCSTNGTFGGGGAFFVITPGAAGGSKPRFGPVVDGEGFAFGGEGGIRSALAGGIEFLVSSGGGVRASPGRIGSRVVPLCCELNDLRSADRWGGYRSSGQCGARRRSNSGWGIT